MLKRIWFWIRVVFYKIVTYTSGPAEPGNIFECKYVGDLLPGRLLLRIHRDIPKHKHAEILAKAKTAAAEFTHEYGIHKDDLFGDVCIVNHKLKCGEVDALGCSGGLIAYVWLKHFVFTDTYKVLKHELGHIAHFNATGDIDKHHRSRFF